MAGRNFQCKDCGKVQYILYSDELSVDEVNETCEDCSGELSPRVEAGSFNVNGRLFIGRKG